MTSDQLHKKLDYLIKLRDDEYKHLSNQERMTRYKNGIKELLLELRVITSAGFDFYLSTDDIRR